MCAEGLRIIPQDRAVAVIKDHLDHLDGIGGDGFGLLDALIPGVRAVVKSLEKHAYEEAKKSLVHTILVDVDRDVPGIITEDELGRAIHNVDLFVGILEEGVEKIDAPLTTRVKTEVIRFNDERLWPIAIDNNYGVLSHYFQKVAGRAGCGNIRMSTSYDGLTFSPQLSEQHLWTHFSMPTDAVQLEGGLVFVEMTSIQESHTLQMSYQQLATELYERLNEGDLCDTSQELALRYDERNATLVIDVYDIVTEGSAEYLVPNHTVGVPDRIVWDHYYQSCSHYAIEHGMPSAEDFVLAEPEGLYYSEHVIPNQQDVLEYIERAMEEYGCEMPLGTKVEPSLEQIPDPPREPKPQPDLDDTPNESDQNKAPIDSETVPV